jgi:predicted deacylase
MTRVHIANYLNEAAREARLDELTQSLGGLAIDIGTSVRGLPIRAAVVPAACDAPDAAPVVFVNGNLHGVEWIGGLCALGVLQALGDARGAALHRRATVVVAPCLNPDGFRRTADSDGHDTIKNLRTNANGVDLNRNFPRPDRTERDVWAPSRLPLAASGSTEPHRATFRGVAPFSEPETRAIDALLHAHRPHAVVSFHSFMGSLIPPKVTSWAHARTYRRLAWAYRRGQTRFFAPTLMFAPFDVFTGELEDHAHHIHHAWSLTVEAFPAWRSFAQHLQAPSLFARFNPNDPTHVVDDAVGGTLAWLMAALDHDRPGS